MKLFRRKLISLLLCGALALSTFGLMGSAAEPEQTVSMTPAQYAQKFINEVRPNGGFVTGDTIAIYNEDDLLSGFNVELMKDNGPSGYVVIKFTEEQKPVISEFAVEPGTTNLYDTIADKKISETATTRSALSVEKPANKKLYSLGAYEYCAVLEQGDEEIYTDLSGETADAATFEQDKTAVKAAKDAPVADGEEPPVKLGPAPDPLPTPATRSGNPDSGYDMITDACYLFDNSSAELAEEFTISCAYSDYLVQGPIVSSGRRYACAVTAMTNVMLNFKYRGYNVANTSNMLATYDEIWNIAQPDSNGGVSHSANAGIIRQYLSNKGKTGVVNMYANASWSDYTRDVYNDMPTVFAYEAIFDGTRMGHSVFVVGYAEGIASNVGFLEVIDGWHTNVRFLNYFSSDCLSRRGYSVAIR